MLQAERVGQAERVSQGQGQAQVKQQQGQAQRAVQPWFEKSVDKLIQMLQNDVLKKKIQILVLEPFLQYVIELVFPYMILICVMVGVVIVLMISILAILVFRATPVATV